MLRNYGLTVRCSKPANQKVPFFLSLPQVLDIVEQCFAEIRAMFGFSSRRQGPSSRQIVDPGFQPPHRFFGASMWVCVGVSLFEGACFSFGFKGKPKGNHHCRRLPSQKAHPYYLRPIDSRSRPLSTLSLAIWSQWTKRRAVVESTKHQHPRPNHSALGSGILDND